MGSFAFHRPGPLVSRAPPRDEPSTRVLFSAAISRGEPIQTLDRRPLANHSEITMMSL
jgi:hypothetical protein